MTTGTGGDNIGVVTGTGLPVEVLSDHLARALDAPIHHEQVRGGSSGTAADGRTVARIGRVVVLARHQGGRPAHLVDHVANLRALRAAGCNRVLAVASVGSLRTDWPVGTVVAPDDFFAPTANPTIHDTPAGHQVAGFATTWRAQLVAAWSASGTRRPLHDGAVYAQTTGPRFETVAEIRFLATVADVVGMTVASEVILAGELGLDYAAICQVDNLANGLAEASLSPEQLRTAAAHNEQQLTTEVADTVGSLLR
ncbi:MAG: MTAP family purine nucleoside phosphorylase [Acidimicrobiia bacterium]|nr:MTAP family purine nucleoside phosphorylase [Acidimicrobiia bacterium]